MSANPSERLDAVTHAIERAERIAGRAKGSVTLIAVSKTFPAEDAEALIAAGQAVFGENRVQEAKAKWPALKETHPHVELHLIGPLQSNKTKEAVALFDAIHTVDREKIAAAIAAECARQDRRPALFVQVNTGEEPQKAGIPPREAVAFVARCREVHGLAIAGLMCIPPVEDEPGPHFALLKKLAREADVAGLSMGMSADFETAVSFGATHVRVGSALFGTRPKPDSA
ncbi:YggS family pyridoxal phosphate-dependent enzyme [Amorphus coralli]|uniref:YggS family pyridoxal phosphate-dependent enzyme n=1 Tax=Amorphus coralli TaxID=340680 RepID=UPI0003662D1C|nr:YggS family pyridoxal phosphate-dependent enzyme [Amorphus coralli]